MSGAMGRGMITVGLGVGLAAGLAAGAAQAQHRGDAARGGALARDVCADCHAVEARPEVLSTDAPRPFARVAADPAWDDAALRDYIRDPHPQMPRFELTPEGLDDVVAYIRSLAE